MERNTRRLPAPSAIHGKVVDHRVAWFRPAIEPDERAGMDEDVVPAAVRPDEAEALVILPA
jgi:hypothetical protein